MEEAVRTSNSSETAVAFMKALQAHDVEAMLDLCTENADFHYKGYEVRGRQRMVRGQGKARAIAKAFWTSMIDAFPDLTSDVRSVIADEAGNVAVECLMLGTQARIFGPFGNLGSHFDLPHLFLFQVNDEGLIEDISAYWDTADWYQQLGRLELD